ncbi:transport system permease protein [Ethanoligenens harbinense YUAN-3]|uniref:Transport system permease protein n=2 Tax=Ethanoligenens harbinense TaxID=253239 RepID=E6U3C5_ETHHY|nr:transport system permease protein [Ethanoligenens harbinense YUAN-3]AVQ95539.1 iron ABC transporter permease [Ethanoligenens harbinense YUAN-3]AYF38203.1 iron ABC transporter permease [Ethanoligenens harbinense]AYF40948.1 iron ABC transporter permease [Ethanoligenens harbinense]QCN91780.1 iron ABC transporter permease [Ethanoligenens harbinense]
MVHSAQDVHIEKAPGSLWRRALWLGMIVLPLVLAVVSFSVGKYPISVSELLHTLIYYYIDPSQIHDPNLQTVLFNIRLPRVLTALIVGGGLSIAGAAYQGMFKNPMVSPDILGASAGAGMGASLAFLLSMSIGMVQLFAFFGSLAAVFLTMTVNRKLSYDPLLGLVLGGIMVSTLLNSITSGIKILADSSNKLPAITFWLMGSFSGITRANLLSILLPMGAGYALLFILRWKLNVLSFGEEEARTMGVKTAAARRWIIVGATLITASAVSVCGMVGWVGLVIPHLARALVGPNFNRLIPASALLGASYLLVVDNVARCAWSVEPPIGILTSVLGVPVFWVIFRHNTRGWKT